MRFFVIITTSLARMILMALWMKRSFLLPENYLLSIVIQTDPNKGIKLAKFSKAMEY